ncbi:MAG: ABC transporter permease [Parvibaculaceae bacterium]|nr:ABC transporter permease [Parvibaculaceae bacterium]
MKTEGQSRIFVTILLLVPALLVFVGLFVAPLSLFLVESFWKATLFRVVPAFSGVNYIKVYTDYRDVLGRTLMIGLSVATITTVFAFFFSYAVRFVLKRSGEIVLLIALMTMFGGYLVKIYSWRTILGLDGILNSALLASGLISQPLEILLFNRGALIVALTHYLLPLAILPIYGAMRNIDATTISAARDLGAGWWQALRDIVLPQVLSGALASFAMVFLLSTGDYVTPAMVGSPGDAMFGNFIQAQFGLRMNTPMGSAMSFSLIASCVAILVLIGGIARRTLQPR